MSALDSLTLAQLKELSIEDRLSALDELWSSIAAQDAATGLSVSSWEREILDRRWAKDESKPEGDDWETVRARIERNITK